MSPAARKGAAEGGPSSDLEARAAETLRLFEAKASAELRQADAVLGTRVSAMGTGDPTGRVLLLKGEPAAEDLKARAAFAGADGEAARKAIEALGYPPEHAWMTCTRPAGGNDEAAYAERLRMIVEAVDPALVIALDPIAGDDLAAASGVPTLKPGTPRAVLGRTIGSTEDLAASLSDLRAKARVWRQMQLIVAGTGGSGPGPAAGGGNKKERPNGAGRSID